MYTLFPDSTEERCYWVAWSRLPGMQGRHLVALAARFGTLKSAWYAPFAALAPAFGPRQSTRAADARRGVVPSEAWCEVQREGQQVLCYHDEAFPAPLRAIPDPPAVLYVRGQLPTWERAVGIVGARHSSVYGARVARDMGRSLAALGAVVVSGAAAGIDAQAHQGALDASGGLTVGVLGCGLDHVYPTGHERLYRAIAARGALISEHAPDERPTRYSFPRRNRLIAGLTQGVIVVEAGAKSGSLITADFALEQGKVVFAVPGPVDAAGSIGPHALLREGACLVASAADVIAELGWTVIAVAGVPRTNPAEQQVLGALSRGVLSLDALAAASGLGVAQLGSVLLELELAGLVARLPGPSFSKV